MLKEEEEELVHEVRNSVLILHRICSTFIKDVTVYLRKIEEAINTIATGNGD